MRRLACLVLVIPAGCGHFCSGALVAPDVVVTAEHCTDGLALSPVSMVPPSVQRGDQLWLRGRAGGDRVGTVLRVEDGRAYLDVVALQGDSGGAVTDASGLLVGVIVAQVVPGNQAVVQLL